MNLTVPFVFFGTSHISTVVLDELKNSGYKPTLIITTPDKPQGRKQELVPGDVKIWAEKNNIIYIQPDDLKDPHLITKLSHFELFIVASYGKIIPQSLLDIPKYGALNVHPSLLPQFRGPSPIQAALLEDQRETGVTIMKMDAEVDHGPIIAQDKVVLPTWPLPYLELETVLGRVGGRLLASILPDWISGKIKAKTQDHYKATFTKKIEKSDGLIDLAQDPYKNFLKIMAFSEWPGTYFFVDKNGAQIRVIIKKAEFKSNQLELQRVIPEGKKEMDYKDFAKGYL